MKLLKSIVALTATAFSLSSFAAAEIKEWNFLVFLNGKNNLDSFGSLNMNQMEQYGSNENLNILVQWGSTKNKSTKRVLIQKDSNTNSVTSPVIEDMGKVDMGDYRNLVDFAKWAQEKYPARHTFIAVWNHGSGWHLERDGEIVRDISWDDETGNHITTEQLGVAMGEIAKLYGRKVDLYGSDACLMAMPEVAAEMTDSVDVFLGSEDVEPGEGWPYHTFLSRWNAEPTASAERVASLLTEEYAKAYSPGGVYPKRTASLSSFRLSTITLLQSAISGLSQVIQGLPVEAKAKVKSAVSASQYFTYSDYRDMSDVVANLEKAQISELRDSRELATLKAAISKFVVSNFTTPGFEKAKGVSFWFPTSKYTFDTHSKRYKSLAFDKATNWSAALQSLY